MSNAYVDEDEVPPEVLQALLDDKSLAHHKPLLSSPQQLMQQFKEPKDVWAWYRTSLLSSLYFAPISHAPFPQYNYGSLLSCPPQIIVFVLMDTMLES